MFKLLIKDIIYSETISRSFRITYFHLKFPVEKKKEFQMFLYRYDFALYIGKNPDLICGILNVINDWHEINTWNILGGWMCYSYNWELSGIKEIIFCNTIYDKPFKLPRRRLIPFLLQWKTTTISEVENEDRWSTGNKYYQIIPPHYGYMDTWLFGKEIKKYR